jgi:hypothetical protein
VLRWTEIWCAGDAVRTTRDGPATAAVPLTTMLPVTVRPDAATRGARSRVTLTLCATARLGIARTGNRGTDSETSGITTATAGGLTTEVIDAAISVEYGSAIASSPKTPNQKRCRRVPKIPRFTDDSR